MTKDKHTLILTAQYHIKDKKYFAYINDFPKLKTLQANTIIELKEKLKLEFIKMYKLRKLYKDIVLEINLVQNDKIHLCM